MCVPYWRDYDVLVTLGLGSVLTDPLPVAFCSRAQDEKLFLLQQIEAL